jgi:hypothetical protein
MTDTPKAAGDELKRALINAVQPGEFVGKQLVRVMGIVEAWHDRWAYEQMMSLIGEAETHSRRNNGGRSTDCNYYEYMNDDECNCGIFVRNEHRAELRTAAATRFNVTEGKEL